MPVLNVQTLYTARQYVSYLVKERTILFTSYTGLEIRVKAPMEEVFLSIDSGFKASKITPPQWLFSLISNADISAISLHIDGPSSDAGKSSCNQMRTDTWMRDDKSIRIYVLIFISW